MPPKTVFRRDPTPLRIEVSGRTIGVVGQVFVAERTAAIHRARGYPGV
jgi:hypothetical protein